MKPLSFQVEELYDAYCIQRRLRDGASKMVAAFNSAAGSKEARESQNEANRGYRECTEASELQQHFMQSKIFTWIRGAGQILIMVLWNEVCSDDQT